MTSQSPHPVPVLKKTRPVDPRFIYKNVFSAEERHIQDVIDKWEPELMNSSKYGEILYLGVRPDGIVIAVKCKNELTANIPTILDGVPVVEIRETGKITLA